MHWNRLDILKAASACAVFIGVALAWLHLSRQTAMARTYRNSLAVAARLVVVHALIFVFCCAWLGLSGNFLLIVLAIILVLCPFASVADGSVMNVSAALDPFFFSVALVVLFPIFVVKQYVLGFPESDLVTLSSPEVGPIPLMPTSRIADGTVGPQAYATVVSDLKPMGVINENGNRSNAASIDGTFIEAGARVEVCGTRNGMILVCREKTKNFGH